MTDDLSRPRRLVLALLLTALVPICGGALAWAEEEEEEQDEDAAWEEEVEQDAAWEAEWRARWRRCRQLDQAWQAAPDDPAALRSLARATLDAGRRPLCGRVLPHLEKRAEGASEDWEARLLLGRTQLYLGRNPRMTYAKLGADLDAALKKDPKSAVLKLWKGRLLLRLAELPNQADVMPVLEDAQQALEASVAEDRSSYEAWYWLGRVHERLADAKSARESYTEAAKLRPRSMAPLGHIKQMQPSPDTYVETLESIRKIEGGHAQATWFLGLQRVEDGAFEAAAHLFEEAAALDPENAEAPYQLGMLLAKHRRKGRSRRQGMRDAQKALKAALEIDPEHHQAAEELDKRLRTRARVTNTGSPENALATMKAYEDLLKLVPSNPYPRQNLAYLLREFWKGRDASDEAQKEGWADVLQKCAALYEKSAAGVERLLELDRGETPAWKTRYDYAGILCDTGSVFNMYAEIRNPEKAEPYIRRALEVSYNRHLVAWHNARDLYRSQERWGTLAPIAWKCSRSLVSDKGEPLDASRKEAEQVLKTALDSIDEEKLSAEELFTVGQVVHARADYERAVRLYERLVQEHPDFDVDKSKQLLGYLVGAQAKLGNHQGVYDAYRMQEALHGKETADGLLAGYRAALALARLGKQRGAAQTMSRISAAPAASPALKVWARYYAAKFTLDIPDVEAGTAALKKLIEDLASDSSAAAEKVKARASQDLAKAEPK